MPFKNSLVVSMSLGSENRILRTSLVYVDSIHNIIVIKEGFETNFASIPKIIPRWWLDQDGPLIREPSVLHDWVYSNDCLLTITRLQADQLFYRAMLEFCVRGKWYIRYARKAKAYSAYKSVRIFGRSHWKK